MLHVELYHRKSQKPQVADQTLYVELRKEKCSSTFQLFRCIARHLSLVFYILIFHNRGLTVGFSMIILFQEMVQC